MTLDGSHMCSEGSELCSLSLRSCVSLLGTFDTSTLADSRKPLGEPAPQVSNLALAIVILVVIVIQTFFVCRPAIIENLAYI
jgi:hypothetical protein